MMDAPRLVSEFCWKMVAGVCAGLWAQHTDDDLAPLFVTFTVIALMNWYGSTKP